MDPYKKYKKLDKLSSKFFLPGIVLSGTAILLIIPGCFPKVIAMNPILVAHLFKIGMLSGLGAFILAFFYGFIKPKHAIYELSYLSSYKGQMLKIIDKKEVEGGCILNFGYLKVFINKCPPQESSFASPSLEKNMIQLKFYKQKFEIV